MSDLNEILPEILQEAVDDKLCEMGTNASDFDKELWIRLRPLLEDIGLHWDNHPDGVTADDAVEYLREHLRNLK